MGKWANYTVYDSSGNALVSFKGLKVKKFKPTAPRPPMGFHLTDAVAETSIDLKVECSCGPDHEEHVEP